MRMSRSTPAFIVAGKAGIWFPTARGDITALIGTNRYPVLHSILGNIVILSLFRIPPLS